MVPEIESSLENKIKCIGIIEADHEVCRKKCLIMYKVFSRRCWCINIVKLRSKMSNQMQKRKLSICMTSETRLKQ